MAQLPSNTRYTSVGFWLPCYQSSFFSKKDDEPVYRIRYKFSGASSDLFPDISPIKLDANIFSRLLMVLPAKGYTAAYPIFPGDGKLEHPHSSHEATALPDPIAFLFLATTDTPSAEKFHPGSLASAGISTLSLVVTHHGFYIWTAAYSGEHVYQTDVQQAIKKHIAALVGGDFFSHHPGPTWPSTRRPQESAIPDENLEKYRDENMGMLTFFQINTVLEGLYNSNLDPLVFFRSEATIETTYTLGDFFQEIAVGFHPIRRSKGEHFNVKDPENDQERKKQEEQDKKANVTIEDFFKAYVENSASLDTPDRGLVTGFTKQVTYPRAQALALDEFLAKTEVLTLKTLKKRIEHCRRALLDGLIEVTHRRDPLIQADSPDGATDGITGATEAQLRGYVMLISAKLPLVANVLIHLEDLHYEGDTGRHRKFRINDEQLADPLVGDSAVYGPFSSWKGLLEGLRSDLNSLMDAISQARTDRMLYEQEQIHAEQETLAEITRLNERTSDSIGTGANTTISIISNLLALIAVLLAAGALFQNGQLPKLFQQILSVFNVKYIPGAVEAIGGILVLVALYIVLSLLTGVAIRWITRLVRRDLHLESKFYYELDAHIDAPFNGDKLTYLLVNGVPDPLPAMRWTAFMHAFQSFFSALKRSVIYVEKAAPHELEPGKYRKYIRKHERNSYRVERLEKSEALHKVYVEAKIRVSPHRFIHAIIVYEILFHRPAKDQDYILKDLRVVSTHSQELTVTELVNLKKIVVYYLVNPYLEKGWRLKIASRISAESDEASESNEVKEMVQTDEADSLFTVTQQAISHQRHAPYGRNKVRLGWIITLPRYLLLGR